MGEETREKPSFSGATGNGGDDEGDYHQQTTAQTHHSEPNTPPFQKHHYDISSAPEEIKRIVYNLRTENIFLAQENKVLHIKWKKTEEATKQMSQDVTELSDVNNDLMRQRDSLLKKYNVMKEDAALILDEYNRMKKITRKVNLMDATPEGFHNKIKIDLEKEKGNHQAEEAIEKVNMMLKEKDTEIMNLMNENNEMNKLILSKKRGMTEMICQMQTYSQSVTAETDVMRRELENFKAYHSHARRSQCHGQNAIEGLDKLSEPEKSKAAMLTRRVFSCNRQADVFDKQISLTARFAVLSSDAKRRTTKERPTLSRLFSSERSIDESSMRDDESSKLSSKQLWSSERTLFLPVANILKFSKNKEDNLEGEKFHGSQDIQQHGLPTVPKTDEDEVNSPRATPSLTRLW